MKRTIPRLHYEIINPALFAFTDAAKREIERMRLAFPDKTVDIGWGRSIRVHGKDGTSQNLGDRIIVGFATKDELDLDDQAAMISVDGHEIAINIPADATTSDSPVIDADSIGRLVLR